MLKLSPVIPTYLPYLEEGRRRRNIIESSYEILLPENMKE
jgi:hypothetical protein